MPLQCRSQDLVVAGGIAVERKDKSTYRVHMYMRLLFVAGSVQLDRIVLTFTG